jgi:hypothetical protein
VTRSARTLVVTLPALSLAAVVTLSGCAAASPTAGPAEAASSDPSGHLGSSPGASPAPSARSTHTTRATSEPTTEHTTTKRTTTKPSSSAATGPRIVSFRIAQKPKCAEGTAVFRADPVPLVIEWEITGADRGALSVDDPTHTPGTYGPVALKGTEEFTFSCAGDVGTIEKHTYAVYTVGGGPQRSATLTASAKILDKGR